MILEVSYNICGVKVKTSRKGSIACIHDPVAAFHMLKGLQDAGYKLRFREVGTPVSKIEKELRCP